MSLDPQNLPERLHTVFKGTSINKVENVLSTLVKQEREGQGNTEAIARIGWVVATCHREEYDFHVITIGRDEYTGPFQLKPDENFLYVICLEIRNPLLAERYQEVFSQSGDDDDF